MNAPDLDTIVQEWHADAKIDSLKLDDESLKQASLHAKYVEYLTYYRIKSFKIESELSDATANLARYYQGQMTRPELESFGREQYQFKTPKTKGELEMMIEHDPLIVGLKQRQYYYDTAMKFCEAAINGIRDRGFNIKNAIDWKKFIDGN